MFINPLNENTFKWDGLKDAIFVHKIQTNEHLPKNGRKTFLCMTSEPLVQAFITVHTIDQEHFTGKIFQQLDFCLVYFCHYGHSMKQAESI